MLASVCYPVNASTSLTAPVISASPATIYGGQSSALSTVSSFSGGTSPYTCEWLQKAPGASFYSSLGSIFSCTAGSKPSTSTGALSTNGTWFFLLQVTDSSPTPQTGNSAPVNVTVKGVGVATLTLLPSAIDNGQTPTVIATVTWTGGTPPYSATPYKGTSSTCSSDTTVVSSKSGVTGTSTTFTFMAPTANTEYCVRVSDGLTTPETESSTAVQFMVNQALTASISPAAPIIGNGSSITLSVLSSYGTPPYSHQWYTGSTCGVTSGSVISSATSSSYTTGILRSGATYSVLVTDSSTGTPASLSSFCASDTVTVSAFVSTLEAPVISASPEAIDPGQSSTLTTTASFAGGASPYTCQWLEESPGSTSFTALGSSFTAGCTAGSKPSASTGTLTTNGTWSFEFRVTDAVGGVASSSPVTVIVGSLLHTTVTISCNRASVVVGSSTTCKATVQGSGSVPTGTVAWSSNSSGKFSSASCNLSMHRTYSRCSVRFMPTAAGSVTLTANYGGDSKNSPSAGTHIFTMLKKAARTIVTCTPKSAVAGSSTVITCKAKVIGYLPTGAVSWSQSGTGSVSLASLTCTLTSTRNPAQATCSVTMTGTTAGEVVVQPTYSGDSNNKDSSRQTTLTIENAS